MLTIWATHWGQDSFAYADGWDEVADTTAD
jgi:hypothetical protein